MIDKKIESDIKLVKSFLEFWTKFHSAYNNVISRQIISKEDEDTLKYFKLSADNGDADGQAALVPLEQ